MWRCISTPAWTSPSCVVSIVSFHVYVWNGNGPVHLELCRPHHSRLEQRPGYCSWSFVLLMFPNKNPRYFKLLCRIPILPHTPTNWLYTLYWKNLFHYHQPIHPPPPPAWFLINPHSYVGHKGLDLALGPKLGWAGPAWKFLLLLPPHRYQTNQNNCRHHPLEHHHPLPPQQQPLWWATSHHFYAGNAARSGEADDAAERRANHCWKRADSLDGISFDGQIYWMI